MIHTVKGFSIVNKVEEDIIGVLLFFSAVLTPACDSSSLAFHMMYSACKLNKQGDNIVLTYSFPNFEPVLYSMSSSNCCFLTHIQISQEPGKVVWYSHLFKNFPQFVVFHTVKGFSIVNETVDVFMESFCLFYNPMDAANLISGSCTFSKSSLNIWKFSVHIL